MQLARCFRLLISRRGFDVTRISSLSDSSIPEAHDKLALLLASAAWWHVLQIRTHFGSGWTAPLLIRSVS
ncbi:hypothetical protein AGR6A_pAt60083 [Agrobacterium sp. NCPPB 925]|nr:hypothetical protein AGR6A_pAt60083 [Agrobacterium sp. NCPPB 925]